MYKKIVSVTALIVCSTTLLTAGSLQTEREIFLSGVSNTLKVIKYQKELSDKFTNKPPKYCLLFNFQNGIDEFDTVRLEALALAKSEKPTYFEDNHQNRFFCFTTAETKEAIKTKEKYLKEKFVKTFSKYSPSVVSISSKNGYIPLVQSIGVLYKDSSVVIQTLNDKIMTLQKQLKAKDEQMKKMTNIVSQTVDTLKSLQNTNITTYDNSTKQPEVVKIDNRFDATVVQKKTKKVAQKKTVKNENITKQDKVVMDY